MLPTLDLRAAVDEYRAQPQQRATDNGQMIYTTPGPRTKSKVPNGTPLRATILCLMVTGCGLMLGAELRVDPASPHPNIDLPAAQAPRKLEFDPSIVDAFVVPKTDAVNAIPVSGWRTTLMRGFASGFKESSSSRSLKLREVQLSFGPVAIGLGGTAAVRATIRFKVSVLDESGEEVERESGEVSARDAATRPTPEAMTANASQAVEAMYEAIASKISQASEQQSRRRTEGSK